MSMRRGAEEANSGLVMAEADDDKVCFCLSFQVVPNIFLLFIFAYLLPLCVMRCQASNLLGGLS